MKRLLLAAALAACTTPVLAADVGVSISIGQPGFYGQIDIGGAPPPRVLYQQPVLIEHVVVDREPIYLRVPPGHARNWRKHCHAYHACNERVYFVQDNWYQREYVPHYQQQHPHPPHEDGGRRHEDPHGPQRHEDHHPGHGDKHGKGPGH